MMRLVLLVLVCASLALAQKQEPSKAPPPNQAPPRSDQSGNTNDAKRPANSSSSKDTLIDLSPPEGDAKDHPNSAIAVQEAEDAAGLYEGDEIGGVQEFHIWDPHKAEKDVEVGDFYFKKKNYKAALDRYEEALYYKYNDAVATFRLAVCEEKLGDLEEARKGYHAYLKILPQGPFSAEAHQALERLKSVGESDAPEGKKGGDQ
jgi:tetratricopeptide (TPR) repeat protein